MSQIEQAAEAADMSVEEVCENIQSAMAGKGQSMATGSASQ